jgi:excisionase family DNA binding protein
MGGPLNHQPRSEPDRTLLLTPDQLAEWLQVPKATVYKWNYTGDGPPITRLSRRHVRYRVADVERWLAARAEPA